MLSRFSHTAAERTNLEDASADLVSCCLVMHELPQSATKAVIAEAYRILRPGGTFAVMVGALAMHQSSVVPAKSCDDRKRLAWS